MAGEKKSSGLFRKYFIVTISIILASFVFLGGALLILVSTLWMNEKTSLLAENAASVAENVGDLMDSEFLSSDGGRSSVILICNSLSQISTAVDADMFMTDVNGRVVFCKEIMQSNMNLGAGECMVHNQYKIPAGIIEETKNGLYNTTGDLGGMLSNLHFIVGAPIVSSGQTVGLIFVTQSVIDGLMPYVAGIFRMFFTAVLFALALAFVLVYFVSYRLTKPLREMSAAAKQYARGDFSNRINIKKSKIFGQNEIDELIQAFNSMAQALATLEMSRRSFVANVSHELKTPMTTIGGFIDGILDGTIEKEKENQYLRTVSDEVKRLSRLVTGMLNMSKIEAGELDIKLQKFDVSEMLFRTLLSFEQIIDRKHIEIKGLETMESNPLNADKDMINQVIYNLIDNAVKFTPEGGYIEVSSKSDTEKVIVRIRNSGKGIPREETDKIFERFYKVDKSRSYDVKGAGMGLYIVKTIIELHGGQIIARSEEGEYTEFIFQLPLM